jgi:hypothetical protein
MSPDSHATRTRDTRGRRVSLHSLLVGEGCFYGKRTYGQLVVRERFSCVEMCEMFIAGDKKTASCARLSRSIYCRRQAEN